jgi:hypothetical protein
MRGKKTASLCYGTTRGQRSERTTREQEGSTTRGQEGGATRGDATTSRRKTMRERWSERMMRGDTATSQ